ncbi:hypothetical protein Zmor_014641 [Zophobas morio]|uniref:Uncharacterized protein n=1 Tax=Zophobas morio TaxID=2755281 RepID=A0AA38ICR0_9CUCU|nr:hypothetical protein Zmor_014641 [Zophobas morio]
MSARSTLASALLRSVNSQLSNPRIFILFTSTVNITSVKVRPNLFKFIIPQRDIPAYQVTHYDNEVHACILSAPPAIKGPTPILAGMTQS